MGQALADTGRFEQAVEAYNRALKITPGNPSTHRHLGQALSQMGRTEEALESYRKAIQIDPLDAVTYSNIGLILEGQEDHDEAIAHFRKAIQLDANLASTYNNLSQALRKLERHEEAEVQHRTAVEIDPSYAHLPRDLTRASQTGRDLGAWLKDAGFKYLAFVSYVRSADEPEKRLVNDIIETLDMELRQWNLLDAPLFFDASPDMSELIERQLDEALDKSLCLVVVVTPGYLQSPSTSRELRTFTKLVDRRFPGQSAILPITLLSPSNLREPLARIQALDLSELVRNPGYKQTEQFHRALSEAARSLVGMAQTIIASGVKKGIPAI